MADREEFPPQYLQDAWARELADLDTVDAVIVSEINSALEKMDKRLECVLDECRRLRMLPYRQVFHSYHTQEGYVAVASRRVPESPKYDWAACINLTVNTCTNDYFSPEPSRVIVVEDYFIDSVQQRLTHTTASVRVGKGIELDEWSPPIIVRNDRSRRWLRSGEAYELQVPTYDQAMSYDEIRDGEKALDKIYHLLHGLTEATQDNIDE